MIHCLINRKYLLDARLPEVAELLFLFISFNLMLCVRAIHGSSYEALNLFHFLFCGRGFNLIIHQ